MDRLVYDEADLLLSHSYAKPHAEAGHRLHGGFDESGTYVPPRLLHREPAVAAWTRALQRRGGEPLRADASLLGGKRYPSHEQMKLLLREGLGQTLWNSLTITGLVEGRGRALVDMTFPEFAEITDEEISEMGVGHLNGGLLRAHGLDEGGEPDRGIGGHDVMWFAIRDLAFGVDRYPLPEMPEDILRPESAALARFDEIPLGHQRTVYFLLNLLMIEFRAELIFERVERLLADPELFTDRRAEAQRGAEIVGRIRLDEELHVSSLRLYLGELRQLTFCTKDGGHMQAAEIVDALWAEIVEWATVEQPRLAAEQQRQILADRIAAHPDARRVRAEFDALEERA